MKRLLYKLHRRLYGYPSRDEITEFIHFIDFDKAKINDEILHIYEKYLDGYGILDLAIIFNKTRTRIKMILNKMDFYKEKMK